jgi:chemotaxis protein CheZ
MKSIAPSPEVQNRLTELRGGSAGAISPAELVPIVEGVMASLTGDLAMVDLKLYGELEQLAQFIQSAKREIASVRAEEISQHDIPLATDELDAVIGAAEEATGTILDAAETLEDLCKELSETQSASVQAAVTRIYEACNFQDITGQRISKVVKTLKHIEDRVAALLGAFGEEVSKQRASHEGPSGNSEAPAASAEVNLLNGPQLPDEAKKQAEIDAILASFG